MHGEMGLVLSEAIDSVKKLQHNDMFPNFIKETLEKYIATSDVENNEHEYFSNQKDDEIDYTALQNSVNIFLALIMHQLFLINVTIQMFYG